MVAIVAIAISLAAGVILIPVLRRLKFGQSIREIGPAWHMSKSGTPTMGGLIFIPSFVIALLFGSPGTDGILAALCALAFGAVGFADDYIKVVKKRNLGLTVGQKFLSQFLISTAFILYLMYTGRAQGIWLPFAGRAIDIGMWYIPLGVLFMTFMVNSVNLTDGLDGLASVVTVVVFAFFAAAAGRLGNGGMFTVCIAAIGAVAGFLVYNVHPAKVFMGDTGSLFLGGLLSAVSAILGYELFFIIAGAVFVMEAVSVILQVACFKLTGKRIFKMSPIHHHFEMSGYSESQVVVMFFFLSLIFCIVGYFAL